MYLIVKSTTAHGGTSEIHHSMIGSKPVRYSGYGYPHTDGFPDAPT
jgi:hypothetical protein